MIKKITTVFAFVVLVSAAVVGAADSDSSEVSINIDRTCQSTAYDFRLESGIVGKEGYPLMGTGGIANFTYRPTNLGEMSYASENISLFKRNTSAWNNYSVKPSTYDNFVKAPNHNQSFEDTYLFNSTNYGGDTDISRLLSNGTELGTPYWHDGPYDFEQTPESDVKQKTFIAPNTFTDGLYLAELNLTYSCEFTAADSNTVYDTSKDQSYKFSNFPKSNYNISEIVNSVLVSGLNASNIDKTENYVKTVNRSQKRTERFKIVSIDGNGSTPDEVSDTNQELGRNLETDADEVSNFTKNSSLNKDVNDTVNSTRNVETDANQTSDLKKNASLETDANETKNTETNVDTDVDEQVTNSTPVEGNSQEPGQTPVPEPDPNPLLSVEIKPSETKYKTPKKKFKEIQLSIENVGKGNISDLLVEPRFNDDMNWSVQDNQIGSLDIGEEKNVSVYVKPGSQVEPSIYQIPIYASNEESGDIGNEFVNVEVTEEVSKSVLRVAEAPQSINFERSKNYSLPILLQNSGTKELENVNVQVEGLDGCANYESEEVEKILQGESAPISLNITALNTTEECSAKIVASSGSNSYAFSEMRVEVVEDEGVVPKKFRIPLFASFWTIMLIMYTVITQKKGVRGAKVKIPMLILILGEALVLIYLSSTYYSFIPAGILPF